MIGYVANKIDLVGISEVAELLGVSRQRVDKISRTDEHFPTPVAELHAGRVWLRADVEEWISRSGRKVES